MHLLPSIAMSKVARLSKATLSLSVCMSAITYLETHADAARVYTQIRRPLVLSLAALYLVH